VHERAVRVLTRAHNAQAIKVRRANVQERIERDVNLLCGVARLLETTHSMFKCAPAPCPPQLTPFRWLALAEQADNFAVFMLSQLDMRVEAGHLSKFAAMFKGNSEVSFPSPLFAYKEVLVETFETGAILSKLLAVDKAASHDPLHDRLPDGLRQAIGRAGVHAFLQMCIVDNFTHSDMHPGGGAESGSLALTTRRQHDRGDHAAVRRAQPLAACQV
jgi:predicted unusual protein kinase regulating ubiquinone biosynthesis (AarF/ABC1/UbiB family)